MAGPDIYDQFDEDEFVDEFGGDEPEEPWHNSTRAVLGASAAGVAVIAVVVAAIMWVIGNDDSTDAPLNFVDPTFSATASRVPTSAPTTTPTIISTPPISTTEINAPTTSGSAGSSSSGSESPSVPSQRRGDDGSTVHTPRRPRLNVTRTLLPRQAG